MDELHTNNPLAQPPKPLSRIVLGVTGDVISTAQMAEAVFARLAAFDC